MAEEPIDLIRFEGEGNSLILRVAGGSDDEGLTGELLVASGFVRGNLSWALSPEDLREWQEALDELDAGYDIAWCEDGPGPSMVVEREEGEERLSVSVRDGAEDMTAVTISAPVTDTWFDDAYERLEVVWKTWPRMDLRA